MVHASGFASFYSRRPVLDTQKSRGATHGQRR